MLNAAPSDFVGAVLLLLATVVPVVLMSLYRIIVPRLRKLELGEIEVRLEERANELTRAVSDELSESDRIALDSSPRADPSGEASAGLARNVAEISDALPTLGHRLQRLERQAAIYESKRFALVETYHNQGLAQSRVSFWFSLLLATAGFSIIAGAAITGGTDPKAGTTLAMVSGAVTEAISALFFAQSNRARRLMQEFFGRLSEDQKRQEAFEIARSIEDPLLRSAVEATIAVQLIDPGLSPEILPGSGRPRPEGASGVDPKG